MRGYLRGGCLPQYTKKQAEIATVIVRHGMGTTPAKLTRAEVIRVLEVIQRLARDGHTAEDIILAARYGMQRVWPFSDGRPWLAHELEANISKAKAAVAKLMRKEDGIPIQASEIRRRHG
jgi:hypothetical protein